MIFLAILFALIILVMLLNIQLRKKISRKASILVYAGGIVVVLFIAIIDELFTMGLTGKVDVTQPILASCLPSGLNESETSEFLRTNRYFCPICP